MEGGDIDEKSQDTQAKKTTPTRKRARSKSKIKVATINKSAIICTWTGQPCNKAIWLPGRYDVAFVHLPAAVAYVEAEYKVPEVRDSALVALCEAYEQQLANVPQCEDRSKLQCFGGSEHFDEWNAQTYRWLEHTQQYGKTLADIKKLLKPASQRKGGNGKTAAVVFEPGAYILRYSKKAGDPVTTHVHKPEKGQLSFGAALRAPEKWAKKQQGGTPVKVICKQDETALIFACVKESDIEADPPNFNSVATSLFGENTYGNAFAYFFKKKSVAL